MKNTILIVDDVESNRLVLSKILSRENSEVITAASAIEALHICKTIDIDLCLLDVNMPGMDGFELAHKLRKNPSTAHIDFIFVTGLRNNRTNELKGLNLGAVDYIEKPIDREVLITKVQIHLDTINKEKELRLKNQQLEQQIAYNKQLEEQILLSATVFDQGSNAVLITDKDQKIIKVNKAFCDITGYSELEAIGQTPRLLSSGKHDHAFYQEMWQTLKEKGSWTGEIWNKRKNGDVYPELQSITVLFDDNKQAKHYIAVFSDLSLHKRQLAKIEHLAHYDELTKLSNKYLFDSLLSKSISGGANTGTAGALLFLDINDFKKYNNSLGHDFGDKLLIKLSKLLITCTSDHKALLSRFASDEFVIWLKTANNKPEVDAIALANQIQKKLASPIRIDGYEIMVNCSIGISQYPIDGHKSSILIRKAETAMYQAKATGLTHYKFFQNEMAEQVRHSLEIENELRSAIPNGHLELYYQPQVDMKTNKIVGAEALVRWKHDEYGFISPADFIPIAEKSSLIVELGEQVITEACQQIKLWEQSGIFDQLSSVSVNVSPLQFEYPSFIGNLEHVIKTTGINPAHLVIELTETALINNHDTVRERLNQIKNMGCSISIDDFGMGYSSLRYLSTFPVDVLKIDKCFIDNITTNAAELAVVNAIVSMGKMLNAKIIVEGVETKSQLTALNDSNEYSAFQGFLFSPAVTADRFENLISETNYSERLQAI